THKVFCGKYLDILRGKALQYPHIASSFPLVYPKYLLAENCAHPTATPQKRHAVGLMCSTL
ncbi:MAG: hypothetical protein IJW29_09250, partial [Clostridia bacterium]|nr:hypothetical protein [Clostridia bacterium]